MPIRMGTNTPTALYLGTSVITRMYQGDTQVWPDVVTGITETWTGTTGAAWPSQWTTRSGTATIQTNAGRLVTPSTATWSNARVDNSGMAVRGDTNVLVTVSFATQAPQYIIVGIDGDMGGTSAGPNTGYVVQLEPTATAASGGMSIFEKSAGTGTYRTGAGTVTLTANTQYKLRFQRSGQVLQARFWPAANAEPTTWQASYTLTGTPVSGRVSLGISNADVAGSRTVTFDDFSVT